MTVVVEHGVVRLRGGCPVEDAEGLVQALQGAAVEVDVSQCDWAHAAIVQALLVFSPVLTGVSEASPAMVGVWTAMAGGEGVGRAKRAGVSGA